MPFGGGNGIANKSFFDFTLYANIIEINVIFKFIIIIIITLFIYFKKASILATQFSLNSFFTFCHKRIKLISWVYRIH